MQAWTVAGPGHYFSLSSYSFGVTFHFLDFFHLCLCNTYWAAVFSPNVSFLHNFFTFSVRPHAKISITSVTVDGMTLRNLHYVT